MSGGEGFWAGSSDRLVESDRAWQDMGHSCGGDGCGGGGMGDTNTRLTRVEAHVGQLRTDVGQLRTDVGQLRSDVDHLKSDVDHLKSDVGQLKTDVGQLKTDVGQLKTDMAEVRSDVDHLKTDMAEVKTELRGVNARLDSLISGMPKWFIGTGVAVVAGIGCLYLMLDQIHTTWFHRHQDETVASLTRRIDDAERRFKEGGDEADRRWADRLKRELRTLEEFWRERDARSGGR